MKFLAIFLVCLFAIEIQSHSDRMCGAKLSQMMWLVCENGFNTMMKKRSGPSAIDMPPTSNGNDLYPAYGPAALSNIFQFEPENLLAKTRRLRMYGGIVDECCKKSCTFQELSAYCLP